MNGIYIVILLFWVSTDAFFLKQSYFGNSQRMKISIKEIESGLINFSIMKSLNSLPDIYSSSEIISGYDMHLIENSSDEEVKLNKIKISHKKMEILKLLESSISINEKMDIINDYPEYFSESVNDGLIKKWREDDIFDL